MLRMTMFIYYLFDNYRRRIRRFLDDDSAATLVNAFVVSRFDYCNSPMIGTAKKTTDKLQRVLDAAARIISNSYK